MKRAVTIIAILAALVAGCGPPQAKFVGTWHGTAVSPMATLQQYRPQFPNQQAFEWFITAFGDGPLTLELKNDGTYTVEGKFVGGKSGKFHGKWKADEQAHTLTLSPRIVTDEEHQALLEEGYTEDQIHLWTEHHIPKTFVVELDNKTISWTQVYKVDTMSETFKKD